MDCKLYNNGGNGLDLSAAIMDRALLHIDAAYKIPNVRVVGCCCKTNIASNTAFRGFGGPQASSHLSAYSNLSAYSQYQHTLVVITHVGASKRILMVVIPSM